MLSYYKLMVKVPILVKGALYEFDDESGQVYRINNEERIGPLREGLSGYLWMLRTEDGCMKRVMRPPSQ